MRGLLKPLEAAPEFGSLVQGLAKKFKQQMVFGLSGSQRSYLIAGLAAKVKSPVLIVTTGEQEALALDEDLKSLLPGMTVCHFPVLQLQPYHVLARSREVAAQRLQVMEKLCRGEQIVVIAPVEALLRRLVPPAEFRKAAFCLSIGERVEPALICRKLLDQGYERVELVENRGQFAVRGGLLDLFPMTAHLPVRLEFFDDEIDSMRFFEATNQRSVERLERIEVFPAREMVVGDRVWETARVALTAEYESQLRRLKRAGNVEGMQQLTAWVAEILENRGEIEQYLPYFYREVVSLLDYLPAGAPVLVDEPGRAWEVVEAIQRERAETYSELLIKGQVLPSQFQGCMDLQQLQKAFAGCLVVYCSLLPRTPRYLEPEKVVSFPAKTVPAFLSRIEMLTEEVRRWRRGGYTVVLLVTSASRARQLLSALQDKNIDAFYAGNLTGHIRQGNVIVTIGHLSGGFEFPSCSLVVITETEIYGQRRRSRKEKLPASSLSPFTDLKVGDYVVHVNHGIARYLGIVSLTISNVRKEYLLLKYAGEDKLYVPVDQVELIQKYLGGEGEAPRLSRLGGGDWARVKSRVKSAVQEIAQELLTLYKARETIAGRAYNPDTVWQQEFEAAFPYEETPDQLRAIEEVKADLERPRPMDRLLCGDVGYGKTEVALRAAFKVVMDSKQVAVLVPTTILAQQHYNTFLERFAGYPVSIEVLSRFRTPREQRQVLAGLERGTVDIVIGTHRLLQEDVRFKDIGLLVVDEEQRFGVTHKERLKFLRRDVDVITLTATPIPRTLHMSLVGARDTSILETPPEGRYPVQTYVVEEDPVLIREAIRRELSRGGQVFFVYNRILNLDRLALWLQELVPEARMAVAHGQMREEDLEQVMLDFLSGSFDVLVCTTIIENGLDIANVNTLIVKEANMMGLAQLYQLRGRVGRSNRLAYAYFTFRKDHMLGEAAEKRLSAIREFTEFGSGFKIAMRDLEIRGAGNILGSEQHGHIAAVGFDLYCRLLDEAVREAKGELVTPPLETVIELPVEAYIPDEYIADINQKVEVYRRIASLCSTAGLDDLADELADRFGNLPVQAQNLLAVARIKALGSQLRIKTVSFLPDQYRLQFDANPPLSGEVLVALSKEYLNMIKFNSSNGNFEIKVRINKADGELDQLEEFLKKLQPARRQF